MGEECSAVSRAGWLSLWAGRPLKWEVEHCPWSMEDDRSCFAVEGDGHLKGDGGVDVIGRLLHAKFGLYRPKLRNFIRSSSSPPCSFSISCKCCWTFKNRTEWGTKKRSVWHQNSMNGRKGKTTQVTLFQIHRFSNLNVIRIISKFRSSIEHCHKKVLKIN